MIEVMSSRDQIDQTCGIYITFQQKGIDFMLLLRTTYHLLPAQLLHTWSCYSLLIKAQNWGILVYVLGSVHTNKAFITQDHYVFVLKG